MAAEFNWWLLIVGVVAGGALTWLILADFARRDREISDDEVAAEAAWIARTLAAPGLDADLAEDVLRAHRRYLGFPPPDVLVAPEELPALAADGMTAEPPADVDVPVAADWGAQVAAGADGEAPPPIANEADRASS